MHTYSLKFTCDKHWVLLEPYSNVTIHVHNNSSVLSPVPSKAQTLANGG